MPSQPFDLGSLLLQLVAIAFAFTVHEASHALVADLRGDPTARMQGRVSLNPAVQLDPFGSIILPAFVYSVSRGTIGYAKPTPVNYRNFRHPRLDGLLVGLAGPFSNAVLGLLFALLAVPVLRALGSGHVLYHLLFMAVTLNAALTILNLLPVPPFDGSTMVDAVVSGSVARAWAMLRPYGILFVLAILFIPQLGQTLIGRPTSFLIFGYQNVLARLYGAGLVLPT
jgi:Zn-dependent protease